MIPLEQKLQQLNLAAMSRQLEQTIAEAAAKNMSVAATIEWLADMELEARHGRAIDRHQPTCTIAPSVNRCSQVLSGLALSAIALFKWLAARIKRRV